MAKLTRAIILAVLLAVTMLGSASAADARGGGGNGSGQDNGARTTNTSWE